MEIFRDKTFNEGFHITGENTSIPYKGMIQPPNKNGSSPKWRLAQWACKNDLENGKVDDLGNGFYRITTPSQSVTVDDGGITLELKSSEEYKGHIRKESEDWPHLLVEQQIALDQSPYLYEMKALQFSVQTKLISTNCKMVNPDAKLHCGQANMYFTIVNAVNGDYFWFGIPFYDSRYIIQPPYMAEDIGKNDATHKFIYIIEQEKLTKTPFKNLDWITYDFDMLAYVKIAYQIAAQKGYLKDCSFENLKITSMNFGWEMTGIYDGSIKIKNLSLKVIR